MKRIFTLAFVILLGCSLSVEAANSKRNVKRNSVKEWTMAVFLNADNNLDRFGAADEVEMSKVGSNENLNIVTLIDREMGPAQINYIEPHKINKIKDMGELDMGDYKEFVKFAKFVKENYPAKHYAFVFWNHGSGWKNKNEPASVVKGISYDDSSRNHISTNDLTLAMKEVQKIIGKKIDVLCFDACLMQMVEVAYAVKDSVDYLVASEETEPGKGAPYDDILRNIKKGMDPKSFAINWVENFANSYDGGSQGRGKTTHSALEMAKFPKFIDAVNGFSKVGLAKDYSTLFKTIFKYTQRFAYTENMDLLHFVELMQEDTGVESIEQIKREFIDEPLKTAMAKLTATGKDLILINRWTNDKCREAKGIAIFFAEKWYIPWLYQDLAFAKECLWDDMLTAQGDFSTIRKIVSEVKQGKMGSLGQILGDARKNPNNPLYRKILRQLNYISESERSIPAKSWVEFEKMRNKLRDALSSSL